MAWAVLITTAILAIVCGALAIDVEQDDDVLAFLPETNPDIQAFRRINERFGSTDIGLVGIATQDPFDREFLSQLQALTLQLRDTPGLDSALSLTNVTDFVKDPVGGGIVTGDLIRDLPETEADKAALRELVMSRDHIVGTFISEDADAVLLYAFAAPGQPPREIADRVREAVDAHFPDAEKYWGGGPFISTWIYETTQADMARLTPWAISAIVLIMLLAFRDALGTLLGLIATGVGIAVSRALMAVLDVSFNIVLSSMPIILFAIGSAYAIHILSRYDHHAREVGETPEAVVHTLVNTGPTVVTAGLTTVAGLLSFMMMDIEPMQTFGIFTAIGLSVTLVASLTFVPAVISLWPRPVRKSVGGAWQALMCSMAGFTRRHRVIAMGALLGATMLGLSYAGKVQSRMDLRAFFDPGTQPYEAQDFLDDEFGGSQFLQLHVAADLEEPEVLREIRRISDRMVQLPHVTNVSGVDDVMAIINDAMSGARRIPDTSGQTGVLYRFLSSDPAVSKLITEDRKEALIQVKIGSNDADDLDGVLDAVEALVAASAITTYEVVKGPDHAESVRARILDTVTEQVLALSHTAGIVLPADATDRIAAFLAEPPPTADAAAVAASVQQFLGSEESFVVLQPGQAEVVAGTAASLGPQPSWTDLESALASALGVDASDGTVQDLLVALDAPLADFWRAEIARSGAGILLQRLDVTTPEGGKGQRFGAAIASALQDRDNTEALVPSDDPEASAITWTVSGMPVLYRGLSRSVTANQFKSLGFALGLVFLIMTIYYRSIFTGMLATAPTFLTLCMVYGAMGVAGVHLDIGTSMLASLIIGAGVDYGVHLLAGWQASESEEIVDAATHAVKETSHAIWTNAIMVAAGFFVLTLGDARPLKNVGGLTAAAMLVAAFSTFVVVPLLANKRRYRQNAEVRDA